MGDISTAEKIVKLEVLSEVHQKEIDDHEKRIDKLEEVNVVVGKLSEVVRQQGENIDKLNLNNNTAVEKLTSIIGDVKKSTEKLEIMNAKLEMRQDYYLFDGIKTVVKKIGIKGFMAIGTAIAGIITALHIWG